MIVGVCVWQLEEPNTPSSLRLVVCNKAAARFMSVKVEDVLGKRIHEGFPGSENMPLAGIFTRIIETGEGMSLGDVPYIDEVVPDSVFSIRTHPLPNRCVCVEFTNVTDQRKAERTVAEQHERLERALQDLWSEMDLARKIQTVLLPGSMSLDEYEVASEMRPATVVGGDYLDVIEANGDTWFLIGDVSGHGVSAGLIMMMAQTAIRTAIMAAADRGESLSPSVLLRQVNSAIRGNLGRIGKDQYMTINAIRLRQGQGVHAGLHQDLFVYRAATGQVDILETDGVWLGVVDDAGPLLHDAPLSLAPGDTLLAITDGLTESRMASGALDSPRLAVILQTLASEGKAPGAIVDHLLGLLGAGELRDDATVLVLRRKSLPS
ncbi:MAG: SpoIIE family protein phosphatase [Polyangiaceae bacterium]|jgi:serine phosphatase RsbU (regulator of sigma subunit)|nr:SpoIIE family protein phosphatase [Polyangiaceae bacterium]